MKFERTKNIESAPLKDELLLLDGEGKKFFVMNPTAAFLWERLDEPADEKTLAESLQNAFSGVSPELALADVRQTLGKMQDLGLLRQITPATGRAE